MSELAEPHDMALPSFMEYLKKLEAAKLVTTKKDGREYALSHPMPSSPQRTG
ncbi:transcriptional regulator, ArsR family [Roseobacter sp. GAI101]|uniref:transcriptional regulator, ArsR family n=1 Tax=Roseobacter sp. (strain GAI101) TaxID=391589 RepID=UPI000187142C|nr:transcriptional regulator, ArsR family [Roseobacter sp. GAI101]